MSDVESDTEIGISTATDDAYSDASEQTYESDDEDSEIFVPIVDTPEPEDEEEGDDIDEDVEYLDTDPRPSQVQTRIDWELQMQNEGACYRRTDPVRVPDEERRSEPVMTSYEVVRIVGTRAGQLQMGAPALIQNTEGLTYSQIAYLELRAGKTPYLIRRYMPGDRYEEWRVAELEQIWEWKDPYYQPPGQLHETPDKAQAPPRRRTRDTPTPRPERKARRRRRQD